MASDPLVPATAGTGAEPSRPAIGLVLGGGGIAGYAFHCGVVATLERAGFDPRTAELIIGTSAGSIVGSLLRGGVTAVTIRDRLLDGLDDPDEMAKIRLLAGRSRQAVPRLWAGPGSPTLALTELRKGRGLRLTRRATGLLPHGRLDFEPVTGPLRVLFGTTWPRRALWLPATELDSGRRVVFGRDLHPPVDEAVAASAALPGFFAPARIGDQSYVDGGIGSPFNADLAIGHRSADGRRLDLVIVAAPLSLGRVDRTAPLNSLARALPRRRLQAEVDLLRRAGMPVLTLEPNRASARAMGLNPMDHNNLDEIIERVGEMVGRRLARASAEVRSVLDRAKQLESPPAVPYPNG